MTLMETLVVIATISILAAMLLPAVGKAMTRAKRTVCQNNQHQIYLMLLALGSDNDNRIPSTAPANGILSVTDPMRIIEANVTNNASQKILLCPGDQRKFPSKFKNLSYYWNRLSLGRRFDEIQPTSRLSSEKWFWHETQKLTGNQTSAFIGLATTLRGDGSTGFERVTLPVLRENTLSTAK